MQAQPKAMPQMQFPDSFVPHQPHGPRHGRRRSIVLVSLALLCCLVSPVFATDADRSDSHPPVVGWIPPYAVAASMQALQSNPAIADALHFIGLQFWNPSRDGRSVVRAPVDARGKRIDPRTITRVRDWAHAHDIEVLLTVYNNSETTKKWDWALAMRAIKDHRESFIESLVHTMERYQLDGIDVDLEGKGMLDADRAAFAGFIRALGKAVHARGKRLTVDTFHSPCYNAPNMSWWVDWQGHVDALHVMGYQTLYENSRTVFHPPGQPICANGAPVFKYSWQVAYGKKAGYRADQIILGMPTWVDRWGTPGKQSRPLTHIRDVQRLGAGIALWDLQLSTPGWRQPEVWQALNHPAAPVSKPATSTN